MLLNLLKAKIHRATVTAADLNYEGSITVDRDLMEAAGSLEHKRVKVVDIDNGARLETPEGPVAAPSALTARLVLPADKVIIMACTWVSAGETHPFRLRVVLVDAKSRKSGFKKKLFDNVAWLVKFDGKSVVTVRRDDLTVHGAFFTRPKRLYNFLLLVVWLGR